MNDLITEARELCEKATPGPWESGSYGSVCLKSGFKLGNIEGSGNADFIARSRTIIPELCDALEKAENRIKLLEGAIERQNNTITYLNSANGQGFNW